MRTNRHEHRRTTLRKAPSNRRYRIQLEVLEDRLNPGGGGMYLVSSTADSGSNTLRQAIMSANAYNGSSDITFAPALAGETITLTSTDSDTSFGLSSLANNGGDTQTMLPMAGSTAIGTGDPLAASSMTTDQRGDPRFNAGAVSIGSVEPFAGSAPSITSADSATFTVGNMGSFTVMTTGTPTPAITAMGSLPAGVSFLDNGNGTATINGTPTTAVSSPYFLDLDASNGISPDATQTFTLNVNPAITVSPTSLPVATVGDDYSQQLTATGGSGSGYTFTAPNLPGGLTLSPTGLLSGTPISDGGTAASVVVTVSDSNAATGGQSYELVVDTAITLSPGTLAVATIGNSYGQQLTAAGGSGSGYLFTATNVPAGLTLSPSGLLSGTPTPGASSSTNVVVTVTDPSGGSVDQTYTLIVNPAITLDPVTLPVATLGSAYHQQLRQGEKITFTSWPWKKW